MKDLSVVLGQFIKENRLKSGYTLAEIAKLTHIDIEKLCLYEDGTELIPLSEVFGLINIYNVDPSTIMELLYQTASENSLATQKTSEYN